MNKDFIIIDWAYEAKGKLEELGYSQCKEDPLQYQSKGQNVWVTAQDIFDGGLNVLVWHGETNDAPDVLFVDTKRFQQR